MRIRTYEDALRFIHGAYAKGRKRGLANMHALLARLDMPQQAFAGVHVAGTNGKGSVCAFLQAALRVGRYKTGLYTSPFLEDYTERMRIDGRPIPKEDLVVHTARVAEAVAFLRDQDIWPTEFEIGTAIAFCYFAQEKPDIIILEVGLGGRLDPTNVFSPLACGIASIGLDHTAMLGDTLEEIALEKAGIAKPGVPLCISAQNAAGVVEVVKAHCAAMGVPVTVAPPYRGDLGLTGRHQAFNAGVAQTMLEAIGLQGFRLTNSQVREGFRRAKWPGRLEWVGGRPPVLLDGAHNVQGVQALQGYLDTQAATQTVLLCGVLGDKDWRGMVTAFAGFTDAAICVTLDTPKALPADTLSGACRAAGISEVYSMTVEEGLAAAKRMAGPDGRVVVAGSLYLVGAIRTLLCPASGTLLAPDAHG